MTFSDLQFDQYVVVLCCVFFVLWVVLCVIGVRVYTIYCRLSINYYSNFELPTTNQTYEIPTSPFRVLGVGNQHHLGLF